MSIRSRVEANRLAHAANRPTPSNRPGQNVGVRVQTIVTPAGYSGRTTRPKYAGSGDKGYRSEWALSQYHRSF